MSEQSDSRVASPGARATPGDGAPPTPGTNSPSGTPPEQLSVEEIQDVLEEAAAKEDWESYSQFDDTAKVLRWLWAALPGLLADRELLDWFDAEHDRVDPVAHLVVKRQYDRKSSEWCDTVPPIRAELNRARAVAVPSPESTPT